MVVRVAGCNTLAVRNRQWISLRGRCLASPTGSMVAAPFDFVDGSRLPTATEPVAIGLQRSRVKPCWNAAQVLDRWLRMSRPSMTDQVPAG